MLEVTKVGEAFPTIAVWENNNSFFYAHLSRSNDGDFYMLVKNNGQEKVINLGRFAGRLNIVPKHTIDLASTTLDVVSIVALLLCLIGLGIMLSTDKSQRTDDTDYLFWAVYISTCLLLLYVGFWLFDGSSFFGKRYDYPEWIAIVWLLSEIGLVGGVLCKMKVDDKPVVTTQKSDTDQNNIK